MSKGRVAKMLFWTQRGGHTPAPVEAHNESNSCPLAPLSNADIECNLNYLQDKKRENMKFERNEEKRPIL